MYNTTLLVEIYNFLWVTQEQNGELMKLNDNVYMIVNNQDGAAITEQEEEKPLKIEHGTTGTLF